MTGDRPAPPLTPDSARRLAARLYDGHPGAAELLLLADNASDPGVARRLNLALQALDPSSDAASDLERAARAIADALVAIVIARDDAARTRLVNMLVELDPDLGGMLPWPAPERTDPALPDTPLPPRHDVERRTFHVFSTGELKTWVETEPGLYSMVTVGRAGGPFPESSGDALAQGHQAASATPIEREEPVVDVLSYGIADRTFRLADYTREQAAEGAWDARVDYKVWGKPAADGRTPLHCFLTRDDGRKCRLTAFPDQAARYAARDRRLDIGALRVGERVRVQVGRTRTGTPKWLAADRVAETQEHARVAPPANAAGLVITDRDLEARRAEAVPPMPLARRAFRDRGLGVQR